MKKREFSSIRSLAKGWLFLLAAFAAPPVLLLVLLLVSGCGSGTTADTATAPAGNGGDTGAATQPDTGAATLPDTGGRMQLAETSYDFGKVPIGQKVDHAFTIKNAGTGPLQLGPLSVKRLEGC